MPGPFASADLMAATFAPLAEQPAETCAILYIDAQGRLAGVRHAVGTAGSIDLSVRTIAADALTFQAAAVVMAHNHPSGDPRPSSADLAFTRRLARGLDALEVTLGDHVILAGEAMTSLRAAGHL